jgi:hypothetical protein
VTEGCWHHDCGTTDAPHEVAWKCPAGHRFAIRYCTAHIGAAMHRALAVPAGDLPGCAACPEWQPMSPVTEGALQTT